MLTDGTGLIIVGQFMTLIVTVMFIGFNRSK